MTCSIRKATVAMASAAALFAALSGDAVAQMAIPGKFAVSQIGAATYTIPIQVPPGVVGMEPKLALSYNSRAGNGILGVGWSLTGLPTITRCPRTTPQDGVKGGVAYDANDRFCLDGQRLMLVSGTYGAPGSTYGTEIESLARVTAFGTAGSGPQYFVVKTRDGQTMEFGNSADSRVLVAGLATVREWGLNKVADTVGNTQTVTYALPAPIVTSTTEYNTYPQRIDYTSNSVTGLPATNSVEFAYGIRPDVLSGYRGGYPFKTSVRLTSITTRTNGAAVSTYTPTFSAGSGGRSTITSISLCGADGLCAPVTSFGIGSVTGSLYPPPYPAMTPVTARESSVSQGKWFPMDVNGDGMTDMVHMTKLVGVYRVWLSKGDGTFTIRESAAPGAADQWNGDWKMLDVNGDGLPDFVHLTTNPGDARVWTSNGDGTFTITKFTNTIDTDLRFGRLWLVLDVNGDGLADMVHSSTGGVWVWKSNGDGTFAITRFSHPIGSRVNAAFTHVLDVNGDGLADLLVRSDGVAYVWKSNGDGTFNITQFPYTPDPPPTDASGGGSTWHMLDANGDGLVDIVRMQATQPNMGSASVWLSKGDGTFDVLPPFTSPIDTDPYHGTWHVMDTNGDGLADLVHTAVIFRNYWVWRSNGDGTFAVSAPDTLDTPCPNTVCIFEDHPGDFLGNGAPGFVRLALFDNSPNSATAVNYAWFRNSQPSNVVTSVSDGVGATTSWSLSPLPAMLVRGSYAKDIPSDSSTWTVATAIPVVESVRTNTGWVHDPLQSDLDRSTAFSYGSARVERNGRGFLGFSWQQSKDSITGLSMRKYFSQNFPYTGHVTTQSTGSGTSWNNLSLTNTAYGCTLLNGGSNCPVAAGNRYFVYPSQVDTQSWDLDGTALPRTRVENSNPDLFGNLRSSTTSLLNADGSPTEYSKRVTNTYYNDESKWYIGRLVKSVVETSSPTVAAPVVPGSGGLPAAATPTLPPQTTAALMVILQLLLGDD